MATPHPPTTGLPMSEGTVSENPFQSGVCPPPPQSETLARQVSPIRNHAWQQIARQPGSHRIKCPAKQFNAAK